MRQELRDIFEKLLSEVPSGTAVLTVRRTTKDDGTIFEILPSKEGAAPIFVHVEDLLDLVDFSFGESGTWELPIEGRNPNGAVDEVLREIEDMCRAVMAGKCECRQGVFSSSSKIFVPGFTYKVRYILQISLTPGTRTYAAYY